MKKLIMVSIITALTVLYVPFTALAAQDPSYGSLYYYNQELLTEFGTSEVMIPYSEYEAETWRDVDNDFKFLMIDGTLEKDSKIFTESGYTLVPVRLVSDRLGADVKYDAATKTITITKGETQIILVSGSDKALVNGKEEQLGAAVKNDDGTTYVPIRFIVENLGGVADYISYEPTILPVFPTVAIDSEEFLEQERMSDEEALAKARDQLLAFIPELDEHMRSLEEEYIPDDLDEQIAKLKTDIENLELSGKYVSCYIMMDSERSSFIMNTITGELFVARRLTFFYQVKPVEFYDIGNGYFFN